MKDRRGIRELEMLVLHEERFLKRHGIFPRASHPPERSHFNFSFKARLSDRQGKSVNFASKQRK
jgi:hypothetical protein